MAKKEESDEVKHKVIVVQLREGSTLAERVAYTAIGMIGGMCALLGALIFARAL